MARGSHPFPSRTRKLSLSAPMVLGERSPGRVGRRRISRREPTASAVASSSFSAASSVACSRRGWLVAWSPCRVIRPPRSSSRGDGRSRRSAAVGVGPIRPVRVVRPVGRPAVGRPAAVGSREPFVVRTVVGRRAGDGGPLRRGAPAPPLTDAERRSEGGQGAPRPAHRARPRARARKIEARTTEQWIDEGRSRAAVAATAVPGAPQRRAPQPLDPRSPPSWSASSAPHARHGSPSGWRRLRGPRPRAVRRGAADRRAVDRKEAPRSPPSTRCSASPRTASGGTSRRPVARAGHELHATRRCCPSLADCYRALSGGRRSTVSGARSARRRRARRHGRGPHRRRRRARRPRRPARRDRADGAGDQAAEAVRDHHLRQWYVLGRLCTTGSGDPISARRWFGAIASRDPDFADVRDRLRASAADRSPAVRPVQSAGGERTFEPGRWRSSATPTVGARVRAQRRAGPVAASARRHRAGRDARRRGVAGAGRGDRPRRRRRRAGRRAPGVDRLRLAERGARTANGSGRRNAGSSSTPSTTSRPAPDGVEFVAGVGRAAMADRPGRRASATCTPVLATRSLGDWR